MKSLNVSLLGATGSIGGSTLDIIERFPQKFKLVAACAKQNINKLAEIANKYRVPLLGISEASLAKELAAKLDYKAEVLGGEEGILACATAGAADLVVGALVGIAGLKSTLAAICADKKLALANKESLVAGGHLVEKTLKEHPKAAIIPVDSEHSAIFQCLKSGAHNEIKRLLLTASGGPFRGLKGADLARVTPEMALKHPNWNMGAKVTIDSATMMNKALEVIEAYWLFKVPPEQISVLIQPKSIVHSMVEFVDGQVVAQMGPPDMRLPISYALFYPERAPLNTTKEPPLLDFAHLAPVEFFGLDMAPFPSVDLAKEALKMGHSAPIALNGADEVAVPAFLRGEIPFTAIYDVVEKVLLAHKVTEPADYEEVLAIDGESRAKAKELIARH